MISTQHITNSRQVLIFRGLAFYGYICMGLCDTSRIAAQQMNETWTVTVGSQTVPVSADGSFAIPNIAAPDLFGSGGPGTPPDFLSDDFLHVVAAGQINGETWYAFNEPFQIVSGEIFIVGDLTFTQIPPLTNHSIYLTIDDPILTAIGQMTQAHSSALLSDQSTMDVTRRTAWTVYRTSNPAVVTVDQDGLLTAIGRGSAFITAVNQGVTAVTSLVVSPGDPLTVVDGFVRREDGSPVAGAEVRIFDQFEQNASGVTDANGHYEIPNVVTEFGLLHVKAQSLEANLLLVGAITNLQPLPAGITDAGIIMVSAPTDDLDGDLLPDAVEPGLGLDPANPDTDGDGIIDGHEDFDGDGLLNCEEVPLGTDPSEADTDGDFLGDSAELVAGTNPLNADTDRDGVIDGEEVEFNADPVDRFDRPVDPTATLGHFERTTISFENLALPEPGIPSSESIHTSVSIENLSPPEPNLPGSEATRDHISIENLAPRDPNIPSLEAVRDYVSIENLAPPDPNLLAAEATGPLVSVENQP